MTTYGFEVQVRTGNLQGLKLAYDFAYANHQYFEINEHSNTNITCPSKAKTQQQCNNEEKLIT